jgi:ribonucleotide monophosphatase NagD (HAD superfamily)
MIGDDIRGDIEGAQQAGIHGVLVRTGKFRPVDLSMGITPDFVLNSIADLPQWWETHAG